MTINKAITVYLIMVSSLLFSCDGQPSTGWTPQPAIYLESKQ